MGNVGSEDRTTNQYDRWSVGWRQHGRVEILLLALVFVAAFHAMPGWILRLLPAQALYERLGKHGFANLWDGLTVAMPLILCAGAPLRSGLRLGVWTGHVPHVFGICALPVVLTAIIYPFTSQPFTGDRVGIWLISPAAQDLLFTGYLYGILATIFPGQLGARVRVNKAVLVTATFFALWHVPNLMGIRLSYVVFQLVYTFVGGAWVLLARQLTGSFLPGLATHMMVNFVAWRGW